MPCIAKNVLIAAVGVASCVASLPATAQPDVHDYIRFKRNGQLNYRRLLQRYEPITSFAWNGDRYGFPYDGYGGLLWPNYYIRGTPYFDPNFIGPAVYYGWSPVLHRY